MKPSNFGNETEDVLVVSADDAFITGCEHNLSKYVDARIETATNVGEAVDILSRHDDISCIVSDHELPDTDGVAFLEVIRAQFPALPFILFTSQGSEEVASRAISAGVTEYLIKEHHANQWERLADLIMDTVAYYHDHGDIVNTETRAKTLLDAAHDMIAVVRDESFEYVNQTGVDLLRASTRSEVVECPIEQCLSSDNIDGLVDRLRVIETGEESFFQTEDRLLRDDGTTLPVTITASHITWEGVPAATIVVRDISERKNYETELELKERAMDKAPVGITIADAGEPDTPLSYINEQFTQLTGYTPEDAVGRNCRLW